MILVAIAGEACAYDYAGADRSADYTTVAIPQQFQLSGSAQSSSTGETNAALTGSVQIINTGQSSYLFIPGTDIVNGARLTALQDSEAGIFFRNNTMGLRIDSSSGSPTSLILATEDMMADRRGYLGRITGARLEMPAQTIRSDGYNFTGGVTIFLKDLPEGISYRTAVTAGEDMADEIDLALLPAGLSARKVPLAVDTEGIDQQSRSAVEFMIISMSAEAGWASAYGSNITIYEHGNESAMPLASHVFKADDNTIVYQTLVSGPGRFALAAAGEKQGSGLDISLSGLGDVLVFGSLLAVLVSGLVLMLRRVVKK